MKRAIILFFTIASLFFTLSSFAQDSSQSNKPEPQEESISEKVDVEPQYTGEDGWALFLMKNLRMDVPLTRKAPKGTYQVIVKFFIDTDGRLTEITPLTHFGYGMEEEVVRLIKQSRKSWRPAMRNGAPVKTYKQQPVTFVVPG